MLSILFVGPQVSEARSARLESHEWANLGALQRIHLGATPYVGAKNQYGPGRQIVTYAIMQWTGFTMFGFRLSEILLNVVGYSILFATIFFSFGWPLGLVRAARRWIWLCKPFAFRLASICTERVPADRPGR
jgi:hypothetical protein